MPGPLHGYRIVDLTSNVSGPLATMILADQGAEVIKVEAPGIGDSTRSGANRRGGFTAGFLNNNRNKRSIALDLKQPGAKDVLLRLAAGADAFVQNYRPGVADRLGVGEDAIRAVKPDIVYVSISGFGEKGPYAQAPAYDPVIQGFSGLATVQAGSDKARPRLLRTILPDKLTAITASQAITAALLARERTGEGHHGRLSILDAGLAAPEDRGAVADDAGCADRRPVGRMARKTDGGRCAVRAGLDPQPDDPPPACAGDGNPRGIRAPEGGPVAPVARGSAVFPNPAEHTPARTGARRAHRRGARRDRLFSRRDRRVARCRRVRPEVTSLRAKRSNLDWQSATRRGIASSLRSSQ